MRRQSLAGTWAGPAGWRDRRPCWAVRPPHAAGPDQL